MCGGLVTNGKAISTGEIWSSIIIIILGKIVTVTHLQILLLNMGYLREILTSPKEVRLE